MFLLSNYKLHDDISISEPCILEDDDLRIIISALKVTRKSRGSVRGDNLIRMFEFQLAHPDTHVMHFGKDKIEIPFN